MRDVRSGLFLLGLSLFTLWESLRVGLGTLKKPGSGFFPFCSGIALLVFALVIVGRGWGPGESQKTSYRRVALALASLFIYSLVLNTLGFIVATFLLAGVLFRLGEPRPWWVLVTISALLSLLVYGVFGVLLHVSFPRGFLGI